jgi:protein-tyrosine phosphatase
MLSKLFGFNKGRKAAADQPAAAVADWSFLKTDIHSHLIPAIDDGAQTMEDSLQLISQLKALGFTSLITTPHIKTDHYPNNRETITTGLQQLHKALQDNGIDMPLVAAAEYYIDDYFMRMLAEKDLLTLRDNEVLIEMSFAYEPVKFFDTLFKIQTVGYRPVLAHPERYLFYHDRMHLYKELKTRGCLLQLNALSVTGYYGKPVKQVAKYLLDEGLYDYCGTDLHHIKHAENLRSMTHTPIFKTLAQYPFLNSRIDIKS